MEGKTIGIIRGSLFKKFLQQRYSKITITEYLTIEQLVNALMKKEIDSILLNNGSARYWAANNNYFKLARKNQLPLINEINQALKQIENSGQYRSIYTRYFN
ncbi:transporter substrate-binding domain-containing protein [Legionella pneumophila serogroup 7]|nr:transporter substrate-binding domain-containing protein [Legionella pneumophila subsp. fraseri]